MIAIFRLKNPGNAFILLLYGLIIKFPMFLHPATPQSDPGEAYVYREIISFLNPLTRNAPLVFSIFAFLLFFAQATLLNRIVNTLKLFPRPHYLTGMAYLLLSSMMTDWSVFSAPLLLNLLLIWIWYLLVKLSHSNNPKSAIFNIAVLTGILPLIYAPALVYVLLLLFALLVIRPPRVTEVLVAVIGVITPYYFFSVILYLTNQWTVAKLLPSFTFYLPKMPSSLWISGAILLLLVPFLMGGYFIQDNLNKMLIQIRKSWSLLLLLLVISVLVILVTPGRDYMPWLMIIVPLAVFHAATYYFLQARWLGLLIHWASFAFVIMLNYGVFH